MIEEQDWDAHRGSRFHRRRIAKSRKEHEKLPSGSRDFSASGDETLGSDESSLVHS